MYKLYIYICNFQLIVVMIETPVDIVYVTATASNPYLCRVHGWDGVMYFADIQPLDLENVFLYSEGTYNGLQAYKNSKLANIMFTYELARRLEGSKVTANCVCPGAWLTRLLVFNCPYDWCSRDRPCGDRCSTIARCMSTVGLKRIVDLYSYVVLSSGDLSRSNCC